MSWIGRSADRKALIIAIAPVLFERRVVDAAVM
jgi:hypothetical protein